MSTRTIYGDHAPKVEDVTDIPRADEISIGATASTPNGPPELVSIVFFAKGRPAMRIEVDASMADDLARGLSKQAKKTRKAKN